MVPIYEWDSIVSRLQSHYEETVQFFATQGPGVLGTHLINLGWMKGRSKKQKEKIYC